MHVIEQLNIHSSMNNKYLLLTCLCQPSHICKHIPHSLAHRLKIIYKRTEDVEHRINEFGEKLIERYHRKHVIEATFPRAREFVRKSELEKAYERCGEHRSIIINPFHKDTKSAGGQHFWHIFCHINM